MKTSKKGAPHSGLMRHEVARNSIPHHETIDDRWDEHRLCFEEWINEMKKDGELKWSL